MKALYGAPVSLDPRILAFLEYWRSARGDKPMPTRADVDPLEMPKGLLRHTLLVDVVDQGERFKFRLVGSEIEDASKLRLTGAFVGDSIELPVYREYLLDMLRLVLKTCRPVVSASNFAHLNMEYILTQRVMCPLSHDGEIVNMIFACQVFERNPSRSASKDSLQFIGFQRIFEAMVL
ncbi:MAG: PAS domain-containing protein [Elsteraceae bacterium]